MFIILLFSISFVLARQSISKETLYDNVLFVNSRMDSNYFYSKTSYTSPSSIKNVRNKLPVSNEIFSTPGNSLQLNFVNGKDGSWRAEIDKPEWRGQDKLKEGEMLSFGVNIASSDNNDDLPDIQIRLGDS